MSFTVEYELNLQPADQRLRRQVVHDSRSREYAAGERAHWPERASEHASHVDPWDQGKIGSSTMMAACGLLVTDPFFRRGREFTRPDVETLYSEETRLDDAVIPGYWPPTDTGSCGLYSLKLLKRKGWIDEYRTCFGLQATVGTLASAPVILGVRWYESMSDPDAAGLITISPGSGVAGGHHVLAVGQDPDTRRVKLRNSWGTDWGVGGYAYLGWDDLDRLLTERGDAMTAGVIPF